MDNITFTKKFGYVFYTSKRVLKFKSKSPIVSVEDIINLFLGLVRLIKKNTEISLEEKYLDKISKLQLEIKKLSRWDFLKFVSIFATL